MAFKIYTKTGDAGSTSLIGGVKVPKNHIRIEAYGTVDELNSYLGLAGDLITGIDEKQELKEIQDRLFTIGSMLATMDEDAVKMKLPDLYEKDIVFLENAIDQMTEELPAMKSFILPGGHQAASTLHIARCVCRRAERICVAIQLEGMQIDSLVIKYLNRLSDYLFTLARFTAFKNGVADQPWKPRLAGEK